MYKEHFGLSEQPFGLTPNTAFFLNAQGHKQALNMLQVALDSGEGFIKVVGEVGMGKTMLCRQLLNSLNDSYYTAYIPNPFLNPAALYRALAEELGIKCRTRDGIHEFQQSINEKLIQLVGEGKTVVLVIDEAQAIPPKTLEALRLISNFETETRKLIHIVLFGQPELDHLLAHHSLRQLQQRITFSCQLPPLDLSGSSDYVFHRLNKAGYNESQMFSAKALRLIYQVTKGVPRLINIVCHKALMSAYGKGDRKIERKHIVAAVKDTDGIELPSFFGRCFNRMTLGVSLAAGIASVTGLFLMLPGGLV